jgi:four helix bundle protein
VHFLSTSQGSASEVDTELLIANRLGYFENAQYLELRSSLDEIGRMLTGLSQHLLRKTC